MKRKIVSGLLLIGMLSIPAALQAAASPELTQTTAESSEDTGALSVNKIVSGVSIGDIDVSGMTAEEAKAAVENYLEPYKTATVTLKVNDDAAYTTPGELGYDWSNSDVVAHAVSLAKEGNVITRYKERTDIKNSPKQYDIETAVNEETLTETITNCLSQFNQPAVNATIQRDGTGFSYTKEKKGLLVDYTSTAALVSEKLDDWDGEAFTIDSVCEVDEPEVTTKDCKKVSTTPMGTYTTYFGTGDYNYNRNKNIENGCNLLSGITLAPGESLSVLDRVEPFTTDNGYYEAGTFENGKVSTGIGGGICQVSTTLYNALLLAELQIDVRYNHSMTVTYVPLSADAAVSEGYKDLQFTNDTDYPVYLEGSTNLNTGTITFSVYGVDTRPANRTIKYESETISTTPAGYEETVDESKPVGYKETVSTGYVGYEARLWKYVYEDGELVSKDVVNTSTYIATNTEVIVGPSEDSSTKNTTTSTEEETTKKKSSKKKKTS
jgi:vancomycin resistance protein YoaR